MRNHFAETSEEFAAQLKESFDCSTNPYFYLVGHEINSHRAQEMLHEMFRAASNAFDIACEQLALEMANQGDDADLFAEASELFHQKVAEEGQFAAVPYDPS